tara:strand:+ start:159 stop:1157 length:999 start_codon:yes stop_codon:yes gene_type:complete
MKLKMKKISFLAAIALSVTLSAQENNVVNNKEVDELKKKMTDVKMAEKDTTYWKKGGVFGLNFSQVSLTNWSGGGQNSVSVNGLVNLFATHKGKHHVWDNTLNLAYGMLQQGNENMRKTDDKIEFMSKYGKDAFKNWYYSALLNFRSQFAPGFNYPNDSVKISEFLAPGYVLASIGMDFKPTDKFSLFLSPATMKSTIVLNQDLADAGAYGVDPAEYNVKGEKVKDGSTFRAELGGYLKAGLTFDIMKNVTYTGALGLFSNYLHNPQNIDVVLDNLLAMKVNKYLSATVTVNVIYDDDIDIEVDNNNDGIIDAVGPRTQIKEVLGIGFNYKF